MRGAHGPGPALTAVLLAMLALGCQSVAGGHREPSTPAWAMMWPQPPQPPRIQFLNAVRQPQDHGIALSVWQRLGAAIIGKDPAAFVRPTGVAAEADVLYVADPGAQALWKLDPRRRRVQRIVSAGRERFVSPVAVCLGPPGQVYLADSYLAKVWRCRDGEECTVVAAGLPLVRPVGLAYDPQRDRLYVADSAAHCLWRLTGQGQLLGAIGRRGVGQGEFNFPTHLALDAGGRLFVTDALGFRVQWFSPDGEFLGLLGRHGDGSGDFAMPKGIAVDREGHLYVADALFDAVQLFDQQGQYLLGFGERGVRPGQFWLPEGLFIDAQDRIYVADSYNKRIQVFQYLATAPAS